jgi:AcrR family transcriptional regulator
VNAGGGSESGGERPLPSNLPIPLALAKLPPGRHQLPREFVRENQRNRIMVAALNVFTDRGVAAASIGDLVREARLSRATFYQLFDDKNACFLALQDVVLTWLEAEAADAAAEAGTWPAQVRAVVAHVASLLEEDPRIARLCAVETFAAGPEALERQQWFVERASAALRIGRAEQPGEGPLPEILEPLLIRGAAYLIGHAIVDGAQASTEKFAAELSEILLIPYLGVGSRPAAG